jgi:acylphosphatase
MAKTRAHVFVTGRVQGVCFRDFVRQGARSLSVSGWVRNLYDERVEAMLEGEQEQVDKLISYLHEGPESALVTDVEVAYEDYTGQFTSFAIIPRA